MMHQRSTRLLSIWLPLAALTAPLLMSCGGAGEDGLYFIRGSARLPDCSDPPALTVSPQNWFDNGVLTIASTGCEGTQVGDQLTVCALQWAITQQGNEIKIAVDNEYRIKGRLCGDQLHLEGGWWLPVQDENANCTYDDDDASEVGIESGGSTLTVAQGSMSGSLKVRGSCTATYDLTLHPQP